MRTARDSALRGFVSHLTQGENSPEPHGAFVVNVGDARKEGRRDAQTLSQACQGRHRGTQRRWPHRVSAEDRGLSSDPKNRAIFAEATGGSMSWLTSTIRSVSLDLRDNYLIVVWGDETPAKVVKRMKGPEPDWFAAVGKDLPIERRAAILRLDLDAVAAPFAKGDAGQQESPSKSRIRTSAPSRWSPAWGKRTS